MCSESTNLPKPLVPLGGIPIICHIINYFNMFAINDVIVATGYRSEKVSQNLKKQLGPCVQTTQLETLQNTNAALLAATPMRVQIVDTGLDTQTGGRLKKIAPLLDRAPFFLAWCDGLSDINLDSMLQFHKKHKRLATIAAVHSRSRFGIMDLTGDQITGFREKPLMMDRWINGGYAILDPDAINYIHSDNEAWEAAPINRLISDNHLMAWKHEGQWQCMDTPGDLEYLQKLWDSGSAFWRMT